MPQAWEQLSISSRVWRSPELKKKKKSGHLGLPCTVVQAVHCTVPGAALLIVNVKFSAVDLAGTGYSIRDYLGQNREIYRVLPVSCLTGFNTAMFR